MSGRLDKGGVSRQTPRDHAAALVDLDLEEAVGYWDARLRSPDCTEDDRAAFKVWRDADPERAAAFERAQGLIADLAAASKRPEIQSMREAALAIDVRSRKRGNIWGGIVTSATAMAAGLVFVLLAAAIWTNGDFFAPSGDHAGSRAPLAMDAPPFYATAIGERSTVTLRDGSEAVLNTDTRIRIDYSDTMRLVTLMKGQALFDVEKDPGRPFVVAAGDHRVRAVGTIFDVKFLGREVEVTMLEGEVDVVRKPMRDDLSADRLRPSVSDSRSPLSAEPRRLVAGQQLVASTVAADETVPVVIRETDPARAALWREGRAYFEDVSLADAVAEMNRYSALKIVIDDRLTAAYRINGTFRTGQQEVFVDALESYFPLTAEYERDRIVLNISQEG